MKFYIQNYQGLRGMFNGKNSVSFSFHFLMIRGFKAENERKISAQILMLDPLEIP